MLPWVLLAKRRNITATDLGHSTYADFLKYCNKIKVIPIPEHEWLCEMGVDALIETKDTFKQEIEPEPAEVKWVNSFLEKDLKKLKKKDVQNICDTEGISYENETKNQLIAKILS